MCSHTLNLRKGRQIIVLQSRFQSCYSTAPVPPRMPWGLSVWELRRRRRKLEREAARLERLWHSSLQLHSEGDFELRIRRRVVRIRRRIDRLLGAEARLIL